MLPHRAVSLIRALLAAPCLLAAILIFIFLLPASESMIDHSIAGSREIQAAFEQTAAFVDEHLRSAGALPTQAQLEAWTQRFPYTGRTPRGMRLDAPPFSPEIIAAHGAPPRNGYVLGYWRGEWEETYVSWTRRSSMTFNPDDYYLFHSLALQRTAGVLISLALMALSVWLLPRYRTSAGPGRNG